MKKKIFTALIILFFIPLLLTAHSGRTDAYGGHHNRKTGGYHYHNPGTLHAAENPYQDHKRCGICSQLQDPETISKVQKMMKDLNLYTGNITGEIDKQTKLSIMAAQQRYRIRQTGLITRFLFDQLTAEF